MALILLLFFAALAFAAGNTTSIIDYLNDNDGTSTFATYLAKYPNLSKTLASDNITLLVPKNSAFNGVTNISEALLTYHVLAGVHHSFNADAFQYIETFPQTDDTDSSENKTRIVVARGNAFSSAATFWSGNSKQSRSDVPAVNCTNGVVYTLSSVLELPRSFDDSYNHSALSGPPSPFLDAKIHARNSSAQGINDVSNVTIFLPISYAWDMIGSVISNWTEDEFLDIVSYHVAQGVFLLNRLPSKAVTLPTQEGTDLTITSYEGDAYVNSAKIVSQPALVFDGGLVYSIYGVLNPANRTAEPSSDPIGVAYASASFSTNFTFPDSGSKSSDSSTSLSLGAKIAIILGSVIAGVFCFLVGVWFWHHWRAKRGGSGVISTGKITVVDGNASQKHLARSDSMELTSHYGDSVHTTR
ncbi:hypothetical protein AYL99_02112 [Fonsecaea erecta]|uniref:FAS1 domain-containing protein n=1 Tax=Fonsecaea erecta TaxID=1367422 RepID=A0A178ZUW7_9EURO|nr:hypothetical protein AYL99_02112 [Fonsecaea erecta]OAP62885.1 hypothetical protein AYL99_02112 [Fonsecaea erecta]